jgi:signal transduction histidine kinase
MRLHDLSIRAKVFITGLGALLFVLGVGALLSFRYWGQEQFELTTDNAVMAARALRPALEGALAHGQVGWVREQLDSLTSQPPVKDYRIVSFDNHVLLSSHPGEEGKLRDGPPLPDPWDIPPAGLALRGRNESSASALMALSGAVGGGGRVTLELELDVARISAAIRRGRMYALILTASLGLTYAVVLGLMLEREIIAPLWQLRTGLARARAGEPGARVGLLRRDEFGRLSESVDALLAEEEQSRRLAATQERTLAEQAGFAEVGALAAQVGHEIKRPLAGIKSAIELIAQEYAISEPERLLLGRVENQLVQVDRTVRDLLSLAKPVGLNAQPAPVSDVIDAALVRLVGSPGADRVHMERDYDPSNPVAWVDATRLEQALVNLCGNAIEAMPGGGTLCVRTRHDGDGVLIEVSDTGAGIPPQNLERILKPFFSTKPDGTGLGLPLVARVVAAHGGRLWVESEVGKGSVFHVRIPLQQTAAVVGGATWPANAS